MINNLFGMYHIINAEEVGISDAVMRFTHIISKSPVFLV